MQNVQIDERDKCHRMGVQIMISKCEGLHAVLSFWLSGLFIAPNPKSSLCGLNTDDKLQQELERNEMKQYL